MSEKYYVVWHGKKNGIYNSWPDCEKEVKNVKDAKFQSFKKLSTAKIAYKLGYEKFKLQENKTNSSEGPDLNSISVDAASSGNPGLMEYQGVDTLSKKQLFKKGPFKNATNNIGEFLALVHGIALIEKSKEKKIIYSDSVTAMSWVKKKKCQTKLIKNEENEEVFLLIERAINWLKKNNHTVVIKKWKTKLWGEIPADFGRK